MCLVRKERVVSPAPTAQSSLTAPSQIAINERETSVSEGVNQTSTHSQDITHEQEACPPVVSQQQPSADPPSTTSPNRKTPIVVFESRERPSQNRYDQLIQTDAHVQATLAQCQPFQHDDVSTLAEQSRRRLVAQCLVAKEEEAIDILIQCSDTQSAAALQQQFPSLVTPSHAPRKLEGPLTSQTLLPLLLRPPKGVLSFSPLYPVITHNASAISPRFLGLSSTTTEGSQGLGYYGLDGKNEIVAVIDSGISSGDVEKDFHVDLLPGLYAMQTEPTSPNKSAVDNMGHGTHVCGSVISRGTVNPKATSGAQGARLVAQSIGGAAGERVIYPNSGDYRLHFERSALLGAKIISNSWGAGVDYWEELGYESRSTSIDAFVWHNPTAFILFAIGNSGKDADGDGLIDEKTVISCESYAKNALIVGAQENYWPEEKVTYSSYGLSSHEQIADDRFASPKDGQTDGMAAFSARGPLTDGRITPMLVTPGSWVCSTYIGSSRAIAMSPGTSMATPHAAAAAAVFRQYLREYHSIPDPTAALMRAGLILCSDTLAPGQYGSENPEIPSESPNNVEGWGALRLGQHLAGISKTGEKGTPQTLGFVDRISLENTNQRRTFAFTTTAIGDVRVVLSWIDYYSTYGISNPVPLYNDYTLTLTDPNGQVYTLNDEINPIERIIIEKAPIGTYTITVSCRRIAKTGVGNLAALAWSATTAAEDVKTFTVPTPAETTYTLTVKLPEDVAAYTDYPVWPAPGTHEIGQGEPLYPTAGPQLAYDSVDGHTVHTLAGWILFDADGHPLQQHFPEHDSVAITSHISLLRTLTPKSVTGAIRPPETPIRLTEDGCTLQWYSTFPGYGIRLK